jgi:hypothetical protein
MGFKSRAVRKGSRDLLIPPGVLDVGPVASPTVVVSAPPPEQDRLRMLRNLVRVNMFAVPVLIGFNVLLLVYILTILLGGQIGSASHINIAGVMHVAQSGNVGVNRPSPVTNMEVCCFRLIGLTIAD